MKKNVNRHLDEDMLLRAIAGQEDLPAAARDHLKDCPYCNGQIDDLLGTLEAFGNKARAHVPASFRKVHLPAENSGLRGTKFHLWRPAYGALALIAIVLLVFLWHRPEHISDGEQIASNVYLVEDEMLMQEISELVENAMPEEFYEITGDLQDEFDDFLQFVIPDYIDDTQSYNLKNGGIRKC
jgi:hypothetical protein